MPLLQVSTSYDSSLQWLAGRLIKGYQLPPELTQLHERNQLGAVVDWLREQGVTAGKPIVDNRGLTRHIFVYDNCTHRGTPWVKQHLRLQPKQEVGGARDGCRAHHALSRTSCALVCTMEGMEEALHM
jgi:hypothetical protein